MKPIQKVDNKSSLLFYLLTLTSVFLMIEISFFIQGDGIYLKDFKFIANHIHLPFSIFSATIFYIGVQLLVHFLFTVAIFSITIGVIYWVSSWKKHIEIVGMGLWFLGIITILLANYYCFPNSRFSHLIGDLLPFYFLKYFFWISFTVFLLILLIGVSGLLLSLFQRSKLLFILTGTTLLTTAAFAFHHDSKSIIDAASAEKPNIIIIGVDALRPDFLGYFGGGKRTPYLDDFLNQSSVFSEALTPIARTFPAWISILTGQYPKLSNIRFDLQSGTPRNLEQILPQVLKQNGYETIYSSDETRFSNLDQSFGFDRTITPPMGVNDFLIGSLNDSPLSNLLVNTPIGRYLFPYSYGNRPAYVTYDPDTFLHLLKYHLQEPRQKPVFLVTHFCLSHGYYTWGTRKADQQPINNYRAAVHRVDKQVNDFLVFLKNNKFLEHSIVIILSDHGEAIELSGDRATDADFFIPGKNNLKKTIPHFYPPAIEHEHVDQSAGHGTDVLSMTQYHSVLAFRFYGIPGQVPSLIKGRVSLLDVKPTLLDLLKIKMPPLSGQSLTDYIAGKKSIVPSQEDFFTESDFSPQAVRSVHPETREILFEGINFFEVNPMTARLTIKKSMAPLIISSKQYADFKGPWVLAVYPQNNNSMVPILVNLETGFWTNDLGTDFAKHSPASHMLQALKKFYGQDMTVIMR
jgi:arylsulfatase A-like enzyme